ncbi:MULTISPECIES: hypothetical protein [Pseudoalteromonas]|uniref:Class I lanthipeptide n=1 Tax=Pseudoalteromonas obscura TaxID=3048491 RepID=A0ABT7EGU7_9GAMM|nr:MULTISPECIES: hypothetical protein [Pseudoalteromonas]MBQ4835498.1 hypothetical protein [Pseudoalteromonas luteoviolacea]MDK2594261.1 hypothetical protein [Pseudoalteromonas sp. P94(2023)]
MMKNIKLKKSKLKTLSLNDKVLAQANTPAVGGGASATMCITLSVDDCCTIPPTKPTRDFC